jgi:hypothetical protein
MLNNSTSSDSYCTDNPIYVLQLLCVTPEYFNLVFLICGIYGMYQGIEIAHPIYSVLFLNLIVPLFTTILDLIAFFFISTYKYILFASTMCALSLYFHCTSWCVTSTLRFVYIIYGDWFNNLIPIQKLQSASAVVMTCVLTALLAVPTFSVMISYGNSLFITIFLVGLFYIFTCIQNFILLFG